MIPKLEKTPNYVASYRPISLQPVISKILEKRLLKSIYIYTHLQTWIPSYQFGFLKTHSTIQQCHRLTDLINKALDDKHYCFAFFLDGSQAFDIVWHQGLLLKIKQSPPPGYFKLLQSYLQISGNIQQRNFPPNPDTLGRTPRKQPGHAIIHNIHTRYPTV